MENYRIRSRRPDHKYQASWEELYTLTRHWESNMDFYKDELRFLQRLINKYLLWISKDNNLNLVRKTEQKLSSVNKSCSELREKIGKHLTRMVYLMDNPNRGFEILLRSEHEYLEESMSKLAKMFRNSRKEVFAVTEYVIDNEQLEGVLSTS
ncbi:hypothetical protein [Ascidiimonas aurantiaca]|uniref:hypothetical protein n=1 Tax=Ascidiimonas aurantiaca TaxID=1685432 RepID=UPI0030EF7E4C